MSKPDVTYLVNVYERKYGTDKSTERLIRREIWYYAEADLAGLNVDRGRHGNPDVIPLPSGLPSDFNWSGKMFDAVLNPKVVTLRIGLIDKSDQIPVDKCCRQHSNTPNANDPLPVGYAGYYANDKTGQLPLWGILIPVFRPLLNLPIIFHDRPKYDKTKPEIVCRCAYYISTADRPKRHADNIQSLIASQKRFVLPSGSDNPPPLSIEPDAQGDFVNVESIASFDDMLDNFIPNDADAQWTGKLFPSDDIPTSSLVNDDDEEITSQDKEGD